MKDLKIGIITMHKVLNYGSALQAFALQKAIEQLNYSSEFIDYIFPNQETESKNKKKIHQIILGIYQKRFENRKRAKFSSFYSKYFKLSPSTYMTPEQLENNPPKYDAYITGSDQVWNINNVGNDTSFLLSFASANSKKISYSSSFALKELPTKYKDTYKKHLAQYKSISVREKHGVEIIEDLLNKKVDICLDPTLLLNKEDWKSIINENSLKIKKPYVLVYILDYAYNPYPYVTNLIKRIKNEHNQHIVLLNFSNKQYIGLKGVTNLHDSVGPDDFISLFMNASFVVTTSFHGVAFSLNFSKPFYAIVNNDTDDDRMMSLLNLLGAHERAVKKDTNIQKIDFTMDYTNIDKKIIEEREKSLSFLQKSLN